MPCGFMEEKTSSHKGKTRRGRTIAPITRKTVANKLAAYLQDKLSPAGLVSWAESALLESEFDPAHVAAIRDAVA